MESHPLKTEEEARSLARRLLSGRGLSDAAPSEAAARKTAEEILRELEAEDEAVSCQPPSTASDCVHQLHTIPVRAAQPRRPFTEATPPLCRVPHPQSHQSHPRLPHHPHQQRMSPHPPHPDDKSLRNALSVAAAVADEDFTEEEARVRALQLLVEYREFRNAASEREQRYEADMVDCRLKIAELEGRVHELTRSVKEERMRSDAILRGGGDLKHADRPLLLAKLKEVVAVHEVLEWQMHEKEKELRELEDVLKAHLLIHAGPARPLRRLLARRLPQFLERIEGSIPIFHEARQAGESGGGGGGGATVRDARHPEL